MRIILTLLALLFITTGNNFKADESNFPIVELKFPDGIKNVNLLSDYGYIIDWPESVKPAFYLFNKPQRLRLHFSEWRAFLKELQQLPDSISIDEVWKCSVPFDWGMPEENRTELYELFVEKSITRFDQTDHKNHVMFCYCEAVDFRILYDFSRKVFKVDH